ncbi:LOW QUALITY PROTEIN: hypothetical protein LZ30DRAFT_751334 [Colletotrichum cereale]|nr:LOW QUALITY PROTEIN: hypothetical protein LZ30DRAFT_751334 [Colletotrichum cereale]
MNPIRLTRPDGTESDIGDTDNNHAGIPRKLGSAPSWRDNEDLSSTIQHDYPPKTSTDGQTEINDYGDTAQLKVETAKNETKISRSSEDDVSYVGGASGLDDQKSVSGYPPLDASDLESGDADDDLWEMGEKNLPLDQLRKIMVKPRVRQALKKLKGIDQDTIYRYANEVCDTTKYGDIHKIFAILVHNEHIEALPNLIEEGLHDVHLPFTLEKHPHWHLTYTTTDKVTARKITATFQGSCGWTKAKMSSFNENQWLFMAPFFDMKASKPPFCPLEPRVILPFRKEDKYDAAYGGFSTVSRTHIHEAHHNSSHLLATYQYQDHWYFIFPWAKFWQRYHTPNPDHQLVVWLAEQANGIASGLKLIQHPPKDLTLTQDAGDFGRHGDLKPENVLWFKDHNRDERIVGNGILKIVDFGLTRYHTHNSRYVNAQGIRFSSTFKAPEVDVVSQAYDIWTLGCLLLEFVTWYLEGWEGVDIFSANRARAVINDAQEDEIPQGTFYNMVIRGGIKGAILKPAVTEKLHDQESCSSYFHGLLTYIFHHLLRIYPKKRRKCVDVAKKLEHMAGHCKDNQVYAVCGCIKPPNKSDTMEITQTEKTVSDYGCTEIECDTQTTLIGSRNPSPERSDAPHDFVALSDLPNNTTGRNAQGVAYGVSQTSSIEDLIETPKSITADLIPDGPHVFDSGDETEQSVSIKNGERGASKRRNAGSGAFSPESKRPRLLEDESTLVD